MTEITKYKLERVSVAIVDDHEVVLEGFKSFMVKNGLTDVETFGKAQLMLDRMNSKLFDVYIVDVELPDMEATTLIDCIRKLQPDAKIIVNTMHEEMWVVSKMTEKHVNGVMYKTAQLNQLLEAIETVIDGRQYFCSKFKKAQNSIRLQNDVLTRREIDVLLEIAEGYATKQIAEHLFISENTVESHRQNLFSKLKAHNMADLIIKAIAAGYIDPKGIAQNYKIYK